MKWVIFTISVLILIFFCILIGEINGILKFLFIFYLMYMQILVLHDIICKLKLITNSITKKKTLVNTIIKLQENLKDYDEKFNIIISKANIFEDIIDLIFVIF